MPGRSLIFPLAVLFAGLASAADPSPELQDRLTAAGENRHELERALREAPEDQQPGIAFLILHMPDGDLTALTASFLLDNLRWAYEARANTPWGAQVPEDVFLNDVLPYACINERRDNWREVFHRRFLPVVRDCKTISEAACLLNETVFSTLNVRYSTERRRADQSPYQSIESGLASCTGLSVLLIDAARAVGIPARFAGTPRWTTKRGNHSWVEIWDGTWHFTGAAEPDARGLNHAWFTGDASQANPDNPTNRIYATSFRSTGLAFPLAWDRSIDWIPAVDVTQRYIALRQDAPAPTGAIQVLVDLFDKQGGNRVAADVSVAPAEAQEPAAQGRTRDASNDTNDILTLTLQPDTKYTIQIRSSADSEPLSLPLQTTGEPSQRFDFFLDAAED